ncbi:MAG: hypothetical protein FJ358_06450 [Thaumarchaeota archaeon]|nr:hypothetical protein [Nitrososphaerota archaeon]
MVNYLFFTILGIAVITALYTRRLLKKMTIPNQEGYVYEKSESAKGLAKLGAKIPDYSGAVIIIREEAKAQLPRHSAFDAQHIALNSLIANCTAVLNKGRATKEKFVELQGTLLKINTSHEVEL